MQSTGTLDALNHSLDEPENARLRQEWLAAERRLTKAMLWAQGDDDGTGRPLRRGRQRRVACLLAETRLTSAAYFAAARRQPRVRPR
jgi:hypothetical protein